MQYLRFFFQNGFVWLCEPSNGAKMNVILLRVDYEQPREMEREREQESEMYWIIHSIALNGDHLFNVECTEAQHTHSCESTAPTTTTTIHNKSLVNPATKSTFWFRDLYFAYMGSYVASALTFVIWPGLRTRSEFNFSNLHKPLRQERAHSAFCTVGPCKWIHNL